MHKKTLFLIIFIGSIWRLGSQELPSRGDDYYKYNDPFQYDLDTYKHRMKTGSWVLVAGIIILVTGPVLGTLSSTFEGAGRINPTAATTLNYSAYALTGVGVGISLTGIFLWKNNAENYYETLKLQTKYWNLITQ